eukprot:CAMPEP_0181365228 /NCGR_PEP_ID=MMETSP1106-20121128/9931_1 /TAXON_ID=81844 /ORGANISM="Mantoniella antarctica, Strain SL-175" /LENGTH=99 /DNA_ID=CAMNT_0023480241 /DNA_START=311 /DNA_END=610 /DNA_ORIENTATION=+
MSTHHVLRQALGDEARLHHLPEQALSAKARLQPAAAVRVLDDELVHPPVFVAAVRQVPPDDERNALLTQLLARDLQGVRLVLQLHQHRRVHANLERACA